MEWSVRGNRVNCEHTGWNSQTTTFPGFASAVKMLDLLSWLEASLHCKTKANDKHRNFFPEQNCCFSATHPYMNKTDGPIIFHLHKLSDVMHIVFLDGISSWADPHSSWLLVNRVFKELNISASSCLSQIYVSQTVIQLSELSPN